MRLPGAFFLALLWLLCGCHSAKRTPKFAPLPGNFPYSPKLANVPALYGQVIQVNIRGRFAVLRFPVGHLPAKDEHLIVYRRGAAAGEVKVTTFQQDDKVVADLVSGDVLPGDEVRAR